MSTSKVRFFMKVQIQLPYHDDRYIIDTQCEEVIGSLESLFGCYCRCSEENEGHHISITSNGHTYAFSSDGYSILTDDPIGSIHNFMFLNKKISPGIFALHASAVCRDGKAYIFCAPTSTGKTTLTAFLSKCGFEYVSDDCVFIDMKDLAVYPCYNPIHLREGGYGFLKDQGFTLLNVKKVDDRYVYTPSNLSPQSMSLKRIFFIERTDATNEVQLIGGALLLQKLMLSPITTYKIDSSYISFLKRLSEYCSSIRYSDVNFILKLIQ